MCVVGGSTKYNGNGHSLIARCFDVKIGRCTRQWEGGLVKCQKMVEVRKNDRMSGVYGQDRVASSSGRRYRRMLGSARKETRSWTVRGW